MSSNPAFPLEDVRVIEFCEIAAGPFCGMLLADMGADVIKVERPEGDAMRQWPPLSEGYSENFASLNRNKRSVALDLKKGEDLAKARSLIRTADVVVENYRTGVMAKLGLGYEAMVAENPALVYCSISAFGQSGPRAPQGGFDLTLQAIAGVMSVTGEPDGPPVKCGVPLCDFVAGLYGAYAVAAMLRKVRETGRGEHVDVPMLSSTLAVAALQTSEYFGTGKDPQKLGSAHPRNAPYQAFKAQDGYFGLAAGNNKLWEGVCRVVGLPDLIADARFSTPSLRAANQVELKGLLEARFACRPVAHWIGVFTDEGTPCGPINTYSQVLADPQVRYLDLVQPLELPGGRRTRTVISPIRLNDRALGVRRSPPRIGEHNDEIFSELKNQGSAAIQKEEK
jgi:crotonobetainyl-CoA:carnitine CoA-transferase CaiB-like acyl-CoA transferase